MANRNFASSKVFSGHVMPVEIDCKFTVNHSDSAGLGITGLAGPYVQNVFMNTSATPGVGNSNPQTPNMAITNPNPAAGTIIIQLQDPYTQLYGLSVIAHSPLGTGLKVDASDAALSVGVAYQISILGDATAADWLALGVPAGVVPAVGVGFIAKATGHGVASVTRVAPSADAGSAVFQYEIVGSPQLDLANQPAKSGFGGYIILQSRNDSSSDASQIHAVADGTVLRIQMLLSNSSVLVAGD